MSGDFSVNKGSSGGDSFLVVDLPLPHIADLWNSWTNLAIIDHLVNVAIAKQVAP